MDCPPPPREKKGRCGELAVSGGSTVSIFFILFFIIKTLISEVCPQRNKVHYLWPPLSSLRLSFHTLPKATFTSRPSSSVCPSGGASLAVVPGRRVENMEPKSYRYHENKSQALRLCSQLQKSREYWAKILQVQWKQGKIVSQVLRLCSHLEHES